ncbi:LOW QUALITY PROTEIN: hypothetical protein BC936DRAFT_137937 [Jimgerdemannia flammicorona]|uniref:Uncharacterized protein n=1 Tax=Jimgerdemannia flammicorona TaxID=994334 RepID=A0A433CWD0_9FUNG|nr:LOW QUALITY PROTEIN: hypothetical protein BC936DRAFT_137937 [Jimgerdemannia flammicorona]
MWEWRGHGDRMLCGYCKHVPVTKGAEGRCGEDGGEDGCGGRGGEEGRWRDATKGYFSDVQGDRYDLIVYYLGLSALPHSASCRLFQPTTYPPKLTSPIPNHPPKSLCRRPGLHYPSCFVRLRYLAVLYQPGAVRVTLRNTLWFVLFLFMFQRTADPLDLLRLTSGGYIFTTPVVISNLYGT